MFSDKERAIWQCPGTQRFYDPLAVKRQMLLAGQGKFNAAAKTYGDPNASEDDKAKAEAIIVFVGRVAFDLSPVDAKTGNGYGDATVIEAVTAFTRWLRGKDGTAQSGPNSVPCTDCPGN